MYVDHINIHHAAEFVINKIMLHYNYVLTQIWTGVAHRTYMNEYSRAYVRDCGTPNLTKLCGKSF